jgi:hypothetical protein
MEPGSMLKLNMDSVGEDTDFEDGPAVEEKPELIKD